MTKPHCTKRNPTGITDYDITKFAQLPEWQALVEAVYAVACSAQRAGISGGQDSFAEAVGHLARGVAFMDACRQCGSAVGVPPNITNRSMHGQYLFAEGHQWGCNFSLDYPLHS
jgi:hypothetical protein